MSLWKRPVNSENRKSKSDTVDMYGRDPSQFTRELDPAFSMGERHNRADPPYYFTTMCQVCNLQLFPENEVPGFYPAAIHKENTQYMTTGGLSLCLRHYKLVNDLQERHISVEKWPTNLIRGIVKLSRESLTQSTAAINYAQNVIGQTPTSKTVITPAPIIGNSYNPVTSFGGTGTFTDYFFAFPVQRQVVDPNAVDLVEASQNIIKTEQQRAAHYSQQLAKYSALLERVIKENIPKFKSCIRCGQSEMPLYAKSCTWCGKDQGFTGDVVPVSCLVYDVDPLDVVPVYKDRVSAEVLQVPSGNDRTDSDNKKDDLKTGEDSRSAAEPGNKKAKWYCDQCGTEILNSSSVFCPSCGARLENPMHEPSGGSTKVPVKSDSPSLEKESSNVAESTQIQDSAESPKNVDVFSFCPECGKKLPYEGLKYCPYCGKKVLNLS